LKEKSTIVLVLSHATVDRNDLRSSDFLSSIEVLIMDQMNALTMQNWEHVQVSTFATRLAVCLSILQFVLGRLNQLPKESHDADFSRIKPWYLDSQCVYFFSSHRVMGILNFGFQRGISSSVDSAFPVRDARNAFSFQPQSQKYGWEAKDGEEVEAGRRSRGCRAGKVNAISCLRC
jgi:UTP25, NTP hydrolase-like domain